MRIILDVTRNCLDGTEKAGVYWYIYHLALRLLSLGDGHDFVLFANFLKGRHLAECRKFLSQFNGARMETKISRIPPQVFRDWLVPIELAAGKFDIFHGLDDLVPRVSRGKSVVTIHDMAYMRTPDSLRPEWVEFKKRHTTRSARQADKIVTVSEFSKKDICTYLEVAEEKVAVIYHGISPIYRMLEDRDAVARTLQKHGIEGPYILFVGTFQPNKNVERLIEIFGSIKRDHRIPHRLVLVGARGWFFNTIFRKIAQLNLEESIKCMGYIPQEDMPSFYNGADLFVLPSLLEGFGIPVIEAMACGIPVVTSNACSLPEIVGDAGLLFEPTNREEMKKALLAVLSDNALSQALRERSLKRAHEFSWETAATKTMEVYKTVVNG